jgi:NAD(P)-dependent dehydrogenase (short-subunit alcohol dehydrogenase family)
MGDRLHGKVCIITGAAQGIGAAYARAMAAEGADIAIIDLKRIDQAGPVADDIKAMGRRVLTIEADVTVPEQMAEMGATVVDELGRVDCLVNNAALMFDQLIATWDDFLAVNYMGVINASNGVVPYLWEQGSGSIVNISSTAAFPLPMPAGFMPTADSPPPVITTTGYGIPKLMLLYQTRQMA